MKNADLHGSVPDQSKVAVLLIDVINSLEFEQAEQFLKQALPAAENIARLRQRAKSMGIPVVYVNDNFGKWRSDFKAQLKYCLQPGCKGRPLVELLRPDEHDYFVLKPKHSGFFSTSLDILLRYLRAETLIITGFAGNICVLFTANDAYMRDFDLFVPSDCTASNTLAENDYALSQMEKVLKAHVQPSQQIDLTELMRARKGAKPTTAEAWG
jgi:nicotinamidase-related amidase